MPSNRKLIGPVEDKFTIDDIGSTLLDELAKGLYQPEEVIREYVANAVDAHRSCENETGEFVTLPVQIEVRPNALTIIDYGIGMDDADIREVKSVAVSRKRGSDIRLTGHKGVGIWAGLSFFESITLYTTKSGRDRGYELKIHFRNIVASISDEANIGEVLNPNFSIQEYEDAENEHGTTVTLESPTRAADHFLDASFVKEAIRRICPCELDPTFGLNDKLQEWYTQNDIRLFPIHVGPDPVYRSYPSMIEKFESGTLTIDDVAVARFWRAVNRSNAVLASKDDQLTGFRLILDGFALGGENPYSESKLTGYETLKLAANYLNWYIGEFHIVGENLRPNLKRDRLEESEEARQFVRRLRNWYQDVDYETRLLSEVRNKQAQYAKYGDCVHQLHQRHESSQLQAMEIEQLGSMHRELASQEDRARSYKPKKQPDYKVEALKQVKADRRKLIAEIAPLLESERGKATPQQETPEPTAANGRAPALSGVGQDQSDIAHQPVDQGQQGVSPPASTATQPPASNDQSAQVEIACNEEYRGFIDFVVGVVDEVLSEEFPSDPDKRLSAVGKVRARMEEVLSST